MFRELGAPVRYRGCRFGLEVEVEGTTELRERLENNGSFSPGPHWRCISDGSLRNGGVELVSIGSIDASDVPLVLRELVALLEQGGNNPSFSVRTSTHVHMNVQDLSLHQVLALYILAGAVEPILQRFVRPERRANLFCTPVHMSYMRQALVRTYTEYLSGNPGRAAEFLSSIGKYSSVNLGRLIDLGTVEFRAMHGAEDINHVQEWCTVLRNLRSMVEGVRELPDVVDLLMLSEEQMTDRLLRDTGPSLLSFGGNPYKSYQDCCAASIALLSAMKDGGATPKIQYWYQERNNGVAWQQQAHSAAGWLGVSSEQLGGYPLIPEGLLMAVLQPAVAMGQEMFGAYKLSDTAVVFEVRGERNGHLLLIKVVFPKAVQQAAVHEFSFEVT